jgi:hypothetical protein
MSKIFKKLIINFLYKLIELIERVEYRNIDLDEEDTSKKILDSIKVSNVKVLTDTGFERVSELHLTQPFKHWTIKTKDFELSCADKHIVFDENFNEIFVKDLSINDLIQTELGKQRIESIEIQNYKTTMFDATIDHPNHRFYTNGILSHNTVSSSIMLLHFLLFNNNKNALVTANKLDTAIEVLDKMGEIYQRLPFFLQQGILNWNQKMKVFENKSRVKGFATTKTASIGQTADFLYLDEFAYLPDNIAEKFYKSVFPTVSNIENSKIIITSTPNGMNLFHRLLTDAEKPEGEKSSYVAKRVYWWQVPKRFVTYLRLHEKRLEHYNITTQDILQHYQKTFPENKSELYYNDELHKWVVNVYNSTDCSEDDVIRQEINGIKIGELSDMTTWKKETIKDIGGEEAFNQEYDLKFINSSRSLLDEALMDELNKSKINYEWKEINELGDRLRFSYNDLKWNPDELVYNERLRKDYKIVISIDVAEGLGLDYSVINMFKLSPKSIDVIDKQKDLYKSVVDFIKLEQIGIFRSNLISVQELSELLYLIVFEHFNPDNVKIVLEVNTYGYELLAHLPGVFEGNNEYGSYPFFRYKHRVDAIDEKIGLKVGENKNLMVKEYQERMQSRNIVVTNSGNIDEMTRFIKHTSSNGNVKYAADGDSNDDTVMTIINLTSVFNRNDFKGLVEDYLNEIGDSELKSRIDDVLNRKSNEIGTEAVDYKQLLDIRRRHMTQSRRIVEARKGWGLE